MSRPTVFTPVLCYLAKSRTILEHTQRAIRDVRAQAPAKQSKVFEHVEKVIQAQIAETEAVAERLARITGVIGQPITHSRRGVSG